MSFHLPLQSPCMQWCGLKSVGDWVVGRTLATMSTLVTLATMATMDMTTLATRLLYAGV